MQAAPQGGEWLVSSPFGYRTDPFTKMLKMHNGLDISCPAGTQIFAPFGGVVTCCTFSATGGNMLYLQRDNGDLIRLLHLQGFAPAIVVGKKVAADELIAFAGNTGRSTGAHLHVDVQSSGTYVDPIVYLRSGKR
ncbi:putative peptidase [Mucinivorans hirudinis]|uniref:Putative peptidase n=1 Tax=Mucinivorans hirudinis TaxID=1433126 RepID=A0A060RDA3_9BACT|nr:putative peptidase [Mucinivorans hirudinis]